MPPTRSASLTRLSRRSHAAGASLVLFRSKALRENSMNAPTARLIPLILLSLCGAASEAATITGTVSGPAGAALSGVFVQAQNKKTSITTIVLSDMQGHYRVEKLPAGDYKLSTRITGYRGDPIASVTLSAEQNASFDLALRNSPVKWNELTI